MASRFISVKVCVYIQEGGMGASFCSSSFNPLPVFNPLDDFSCVHHRKRKPMKHYFEGVYCGGKTILKQGFPISHWLSAASWAWESSLRFFWSVIWIIKEGQTQEIHSHLTSNTL